MNDCDKLADAQRRLFLTHAAAGATGAAAMTTLPAAPAGAAPLRWTRQATRSFVSSPHSISSALKVPPLIWNSVPKKPSTASTPR